MKYRIAALRSSDALEFPPVEVDWIGTAMHRLAVLARADVPGVVYAVETDGSRREIAVFDPKGVYA